MVFTRLLQNQYQKNQRYCKFYLTQTDKEWKSFSQIFGEKDILFMKFESFSIQRFNERVQWFAKDDDLLNKLMK